MRTDWTISVVVHVLVLGASVISFAARPHEKSESQSVSVDIISSSELSQLTLGSKSAQKPADKPLVDKLGDAKPPPDDPSAKPVVNKQDIKVAAASPPPPEPKPEPVPPELKAAPPPPQASDPSP